MTKRVKGDKNQIIKKIGDLRFLRFAHNLGLRYILAFKPCTKLINIICMKTIKKI